jgi:uncharacterized membrane protein YjfL (UPF0719 family)
MADLATIGGALLNLVVAIVLAVAAQFIAIWAFNKMTKDVDEMVELKKGNVAVGIVVAAVVLAVSAVIASGVDALANTVPTSMETSALLKFGFGALSLLVSIGLAIGVQFLALKVFDQLTEGIDEQRELKKGNVAVALLLGAIMYAIAQVTSAGIRGLTAVLGV